MVFYCIEANDSDARTAPELTAEHWASNPVKRAGWMEELRMGEVVAGESWPSAAQ